MPISEDLRSTLAVHIGMAGWDEIERKTAIPAMVFMGFLEHDLDIPLSVAETIAGYLGCRLTRPNARWRREWQEKRTAPPKKPACRASSAPAIVPFPGAKR
jgi:hypothetical protein